MYCHRTVEKQIQLRLINDLVRTWNLCQTQKKKSNYMVFNLRTRYAYSKSKNVSKQNLSSDNSLTKKLVTFFLFICIASSYTHYCPLLAERFISQCGHRTYGANLSLIYTWQEGLFDAFLTTSPS